MKLLTKVFRHSYGILAQTQSEEEPSLTKHALTLAFLKQSLLLTTKYSQKFTFNFIKLFKHSQGALNFNELNLRKCLTIRLNCGDDQGQSLLQNLTMFDNPC